MQPPAPLLARLASTFGLRWHYRLRLRPGVGAWIPLEGRMAVQAGPGTNHAAKDRAGPDRPVMRTLSLGDKWSNRKQGNEPGQASGIVPDHRPRMRAGKRADIASLHMLPFTGVLNPGGLQCLPLSFSCPGHPQLHLPARKAAASSNLDNTGTLIQLVQPKRFASFDRPGKRLSLPRGWSLQVSRPCLFPPDSRGGRHHSGPLRLTRSPSAATLRLRHFRELLIRRMID